MSANSSTPACLRASFMALHSDIDAPNILLRPSSHRPTRQSMQTFGGGGGGGEGAMNLNERHGGAWLFVCGARRPPAPKVAFAFASGARGGVVDKLIG